VLNPCCFPGVNGSSVNVILVHIVIILLKFTRRLVATISTTCGYCQQFVEPRVGPGSSVIAPIRFLARWHRGPLNQALFSLDRLQNELC